MQNGILALLLLFAALFGVGCYTLSGISIAPDVNTFYVEQLLSNAVNAPPTLAQDVTEALKQKIQNESRLKFNDLSPDVEFKGSVVDFRVSSEAPQAGESSAINRLTIITAIEFVNHKDPKQGWKKNFSFFYDFGASQDLASIQTVAIQSILDQMIEDIFNKAFTNW